MNNYEKLAAAMRDQVAHPKQNPNEALRKAGLEQEKGGTHEKKPAQRKKPMNWMDAQHVWQQEQEKREERYPIKPETEKGN